jgi:hypothetical protein
VLMISSTSLRMVRCKRLYRYKNNRIQNLVEFATKFWTRVRLRKDRAVS